MAQQATILAVDPAAPDPDGMARMGAAIRAGEVVAFPTETVYGLGADATNPDAVARIFAAKGRPSSDPLIVHIAGIEQLPQVTGYAPADLPPATRVLAERFWPGPLTLVLPRGPAIPAAVTAGLATVGVRMPAHPVARALIAAAGVPIAAPSANQFGHTSPTTAQHVFADLGSRIPWIIDGGACPVGVESTIVDVMQSPPRVLRPGGVALEDLAAALGGPVAFQERAAVRDGVSQAPGMLLSHYAPRARLLVFDDPDIPATWQRAIAEVQARSAQGMRVGALAPDALAAAFTAAGASAVAVLGALDDPRTVAQQLFAALRRLDDAGVALIISGSFTAAGLGLAVRDRLWRAAGGVVLSLTAAPGAC